MLIVKDLYVDSAVEEEGDLPFLEHMSKPFKGETLLNANRLIFLYSILESTNEILSEREVQF